MSGEPGGSGTPAFVSDSPRDVAVIGAGMIGLSTAWFLQEAGAQVTVYERRHVGAGASWGNAGWLTPGLTAPLPEPAVLRYGLRAVLSARSPVYVPLRADRRLWHFLASFAANSTTRRWRRGMAAYVALNERSLEAFDVLAAGGVTAATTPADPFLACFARERDSRGMLAELEQIRDAGQDVTFRPLTGWRIRSLEPALTDRVGAAIQISGQRYLHPPQFVRSLADAVRARGGRILEAGDVAEVRPGPAGVSVATRSGSNIGMTRWSSPPARCSATLRDASACGDRCRPGAATASACRWNGCPQARCTSRRRGWPARPWTAGCGWRG